ncbi:MAG: YkgJ family cysteine cluster protein [Pelotomaculum sp.]|uniref:Fe-S-cluster oxidoreductase n=1 Tax=Pelotomaculum thermopropionicum (strain DSM 13744 / JCM 10971 / SI) TaxID=370438 RepID=A5D4U8_PELTS|nr:YkgJ family cysteine cluster protein [Pelotomaculum sp.]BAF58735.1 hypothetical protein PTH_0554 [Pelotomaculum thermopropionicum SI]
MQEAVLAVPQRFGTRWGYDLVVKDEAASVQDYLDAVCRIIREYPLSRTRKKAPSCAGCDLCCKERAPLTWIDVLNLRKYLKMDKAALQEFLDLAGYILVDGPAVDITLRRTGRGCVFLNRQSRLCSVYPARPLVCQTFFCCPVSRRAAGLRQYVVNAGEDELVRQWLLQAGKRGGAPAFHEGYRPKLRLGDWQPNAFTGREHYRQVLLKELCPPRLWQKLYVPAGRGGR